MTSLASVFVEVRPDTSAFGPELKASLAKTREAVDVAASLDTSKLKPQLAALKADLRSIQVTKATIDADATKASAKIRGLQAELRGLNERVKLNADDTEAKAKITALKAEIASLQGGKAKLSIDSSMASAHLKALQAQLSVFEGKTYTTKVKVDTRGGSKGISTLMAAIVGIAPVAVPALAAVTAGVGTLGAALATAGGASAALGGVVKADVKEYQDLLKAIKADQQKLATTDTAVASARASLAASAQSSASAHQSALARVAAVATRGTAAYKAVQVQLAGTTKGTAAYQAAQARLTATGVKATAANKAAQLQLASSAKGSASYTAASQRLKLALENQKNAQEALNADTKVLNSQFGPLANGLDSFKTSLGKLTTETRPAVIGLMGHSLSVVAGILPRLAPLVTQSAHAVNGLVDEFARFTKTAEFQGILDFFQTHGPAAITSFGHIIGNVAVGVGNLLGAFTPFQTSFLGGFEAMTRKFETWSAGFGKSAGFSRFMDYVRRTLPGVRDLFSNLAEFAGKLLVALAPLAHVELGALTTVLKGLNSLSPRQLAALAGTIATVVLGMKAWAIASAAVAGAEKLGIARAKLMGDTVATAGTQIEGASLKVDAAGTRIGGLKGHLTAVKGAIAGLAGSAGIGLLLDGATRANKKVGTLETTLGGAATGFAVGGPWGAAIGAGAGLLVGLASHFKDTSQAARDAFKRMQSTSVLKTVNRNLRDLKGTLDTVTGAYTDATRAAVLQKLQQSGALDVGKKYGITAREMVNSVLGQGAALSRLAPVMSNYHSKIAAIEHQQATLSVATDKYGNLLKIDVHGNLVKLSQSEQEHYNALEKTKRGYQAQADQLRRIGPQLHGYARNIQDSTAATADYTGKLKGIPKRVRSFIEANGIIPTAKGVGDLVAKFHIIDKKKIRTLIEASGASATVKDVQRVIDRIHGIPAKFTSRAEFLAAKAMAASDAFKEYVNKNQGKHNLLDRAAWNDQKARVANAAWKKYLNDNQGKHNLLDRATWDNRRAAKDALDWRIYVNAQRAKHNLLSPAVFAATKAKNDARSYQEYVNAQVAKIKDRTVDIKLSAHAAQVLGTSRRQKNQAATGPTGGFATGGAVFGAGTATSDSIPALLSNNEHVWTAREVAAAGGHGAVEAIRAAVLKGRVSAFATGGAVTLTPKTQTAAVSTSKIDSYFGGLAQIIAAAVTRAAAAIGNGLHRPVNGGVITQGIHDAYTGFPAIDFGVPVGTPVYAGASGRVAISRDLMGSQNGGYRSYGRYIQLNNGRFSTLYAHLSKRLVQAGQVVSGGQRIGLSGNTGHSTGPHLHFGAHGISPYKFVHPSAGGGGPLQAYNGRQGHLSPAQAKAAAFSMMPSGWSRSALNAVVMGESGWRWNADNPNSSAYGIPQALPGSKMRSAGADWHDNAITQIRWMFDYIRNRYGSPSGALAHERVHGWYAKGGPVIGSGTGTSDSVLARVSNGEHIWTAQEVAGAGGHAAVQALRAYAKGGPVGANATASASVTRQISAQITAMRNALDTSKFYRSLVPYIKKRLSGKQEETYLARAHKAFVSDLKRNSMDRIRSNTTALRKSSNPNRDYAALTAYIRKHLTGREERDRLRMAKDALSADKKRLATAAATANSHRIRGLGGTTIRNIAEGRQGSMATVIKQLSTLIRQDLHGRRERQLLGGVHGLSSIQARSVAINTQLAAAQRTRGSVVTDRNAIRSAFTGFGPNLADYAQSPTGILGGLRGQLASVRKFTANIRQLRKLGYPNSIVSQVVGLGLTDGIAAAAQLIGLSKADRRSVINTFGALDRTARGSGVAVSNEMYRGAIKAADAQIKRLQTRQKHIDAVFEHAAEALARRLARLLRIPVAKPKRVKATHDAGGWLGTGVQLTANYTGKPEAVYTARQQSQMDEDRAMMRKLIARYESGQSTGRMAPFIQNAVIRETVDLERYERQRAFRERNTNVGG